MNKEVMTPPANHGEKKTASKYCTECGAKVVAKKSCHRCGGRSQVGNPSSLGYSTNYDRF